ncbi:MAG: dipeptide epimerase [Chitinophagaceae bacterium]|nr:dipeptide epimerase [Chitinophagaceae bacterium]
MDIRSVKVYKKRFPLSRPYTITRETYDYTEVVFLELELSNGIKGTGAASPEYAVVGESPETTYLNLQSDEVAKLAGKDIRQCLSLIRLYNRLYSSYPGTRAAIDIALHDAFTQWLEIPLVDFYGRQHQGMITSVTIGIKDVAATLEEAMEYYDRGFKALKIKTGLHAAEDAERIIRLREKFGNHFEIRVDANAGYTLEQLQTFLELVKDQHVELIEQPLPPGNDHALEGLPSSVKTKLAADESLKDADTALQLVKEGVYGIFNIKLMKCGGITGAFDIAGVARNAGKKLFWGCNDESCISITAALHAAFACEHTRYLDLDGSLDLADDVAKGGFVLREGYMQTVNRPGLGLNILF